jgi:hypothetical protein
MSRPRFQFTLGQLVKLIFVCALVLPSLRTPGGAMVLALIGLVLPGYILDRIKGGTGIGGGILCGCLTFVGYGLISYIDAYLFRDPTVVIGDPLLILPLFLVAGLLWGAAVSIALHFIVAKTNRTHLTDDSCGPIVWRRLDDGVTG